jgi:hypothetical protein
MFLPIGVINVTTAARSRRKRMNTTTASEKNAPVPEAPQPNTKRTPAKKAKLARKAGRVK